MFRTKKKLNPTIHPDDEPLGLRALVERQKLLNDFEQARVRLLVHLGNHSVSMHSATGYDTTIKVLIKRLGDHGQIHMGLRILAARTRDALRAKFPETYS